MALRGSLNKEMEGLLKEKHTNDAQINKSIWSKSIKLMGPGFYQTGQHIVKRDCNQFFISGRANKILREAEQ